MNPTDNAVTESQTLTLLSVGSLIALVVLCAAWELWLTPVCPGGSRLALKALLLAWPLPSMLRKNCYTMQWASMFIPLLFAKGIVRVTSGVGLSRLPAWGEVVLSVMLFMATIFYLRPFRRAIRTRPSQSI